MFADKYMDANQQHSESSSVNFLQEEHAKTLKGLHSEIHKLQQKCAKLTFELTMAGGNVSSNQESSLIEEELARNREDIVLLRSQITLHRERVDLLEHELQTLRKETRELLKEKQDVVRTAQHQLEEKSTTIAQLVSKLQQTQLLLHKMQQSNDTAAVPGPGLFPVPPKDPPPPPTSTESINRKTRGHITRRLRRSLTSPAQPSLECISYNSITESMIPSLPISASVSESYQQSQPVVTSAKPRLISPSPPPDTHIRSRDQLLLTQVKQPQILQRTLAMKLQVQKPVLPPIQSEEVPHTIPPPPPNYHRRRRYTLNKGSGLSSAPCSLRLVNYSTSHDKGDEEEEDGKEKEPEGTLMIKHQLNQGKTESLYFKSQRK